MVGVYLPKGQWLDIEQMLAVIAPAPVALMGFVSQMNRTPMS